MFEFVLIRFFSYYNMGYNSKKKNAKNWQNNNTHHDRTWKNFYKSHLTLFFFLEKVENMFAFDIMKIMLSNTKVQTFMDYLSDVFVR